MSSAAMVPGVGEMIQSLNLDEIAQVSGGTVVYRAFGWVGVAYAIRDLAETAYDIGYWVGSN